MKQQKKYVKQKQLTLNQYNFKRQDTTFFTYQLQNFNFINKKFCPQNKNVRKQKKISRQSKQQFSTTQIQKSFRQKQFMESSWDQGQQIFQEDEQNFILQEKALNLQQLNVKQLKIDQFINQKNYTKNDWYQLNNNKNQIDFCFLFGNNKECSNNEGQHLDLVQNQQNFRQAQPIQNKIEEFQQKNDSSIVIEKKSQQTTAIHSLKGISKLTYAQLLKNKNKTLTTKYIKDSIIQKLVDEKNNIKKDFMHGQKQQLKVQEYQIRNVKRRVYDCLNVLLAGGIIKKVNSQYCYQELRQSYIQQIKNCINSKNDCIKDLSKECNELQKKYAELSAMHQGMKNLKQKNTEQSMQSIQQRQIKKSVNKIQQQMIQQQQIGNQYCINIDNSQKVQFPFVLIYSSDHQISVQISQQTCEEVESNRNQKQYKKSQNERIEGVYLSNVIITGKDLQLLADLDCLSFFK